MEKERECVGDVELLMAYGLCEMVKSNNLYAVYAACLMLHNSRQPRTHTYTHIHIYRVDTSYPFRSREATSALFSPLPNLHG